MVESMHWLLSPALAALHFAVDLLQHILLSIPSPQTQELHGQDAVTSGAADVPLPEAPAPQGFWAAVAALLCMARVELMRMGLAMGLAEALPASALQAVRFVCCVCIAVGGSRECVVHTLLLVLLARASMHSEHSSCLVLNWLWMCVMLYFCCAFSQPATSGEDVKHLDMSLAHHQVQVPCHEKCTMYWVHKMSERKHCTGLSLCHADCRAFCCTSPMAPWLACPAWMLMCT